MNIASMTGFARVQGSFQTVDENINWAWEIKSVNNKSLDVKLKLPFGFEEQSLLYKAKAAEFLTRGSVSAFLEVEHEKQVKKIKIDEDLLQQLAQRAVALTEQFNGKLAPSSAAELLAQRGVIEFEETEISEEEQAALNDVLMKSFAEACQKLQDDRRKEGEKIAQALQVILDKIANGLEIKLKELLDFE